MGAELKKLDSLSKQIDQYESHLAMVRNDMQSSSAKRDEAKIELEEVKSDIQKRLAACEIECAKIRKAADDETNRVKFEKERLAEERQRISRERNDLAGAKDALEMSRRDLENEKRRVSGFVQIIDQAVKVWR